MIQPSISPSRASIFGPRGITAALFILFTATSLATLGSPGEAVGDLPTDPSPRERVSINDGWRFMQYESASEADDLIYDLRPRPNEGHAGEATDPTPLKPWILPSGNRFLPDPQQHHLRPEGNPGHDFPYVQADFDDSSWEPVDLPHDWTIAGPFNRKALDIPAEDAGRDIFLEIDGAMSYAIVWLNGHLVGGWSFGYASWRLDLSFVTVQITDKDGRPVPRANHRLSFEIDGPDEIGATDNGDPRDFESSQSTDRKAFNGLCLVIVRRNPGEAGEIRLTVTSDGLETGSTVITTAPALEDASDS